MFVEREWTSDPAMALGIRSHIAGLSLSNPVYFLTALGIHCSRKAIYEWVQKADRQPDAGQCPNHVALDVTDLSEQAVYDIEESAYVRKAAVDEEMKTSRLQGLKDRVAATEGQDAAALKAEIEELEQRINDFTSFSTRAQVQQDS